jgi:hypothetical protein
VCAHHVGFANFGASRLFYRELIKLKGYLKLQEASIISGIFWKNVIYHTILFLPQEAKNKRQFSQIFVVENAAEARARAWKRLGRCRAFSVTVSKSDILYC